MKPLNGKPFICAGITPIGDNYDIIWNSLVEKYQYTRAIAQTYLKRLFSFKPLTSDDSLDVFVECFVPVFEALKKLKVDLADFMMLYLALSKVDSETEKAFEMSARKS